MKRLSKICAILAICGTATLYADDAAVTPTTSTTTKPTTTLTVVEMRESALKLEEQIKGDQSHVLRLKDLARKQKDVIKLNCVNDRLVQLKAQMNLATRRTCRCRTRWAVKARTGSRITISSRRSPMPCASFAKKRTHAPANPSCSSRSPEWTCNVPRSRMIRPTVVRSTPPEPPVLMSSLPVTRLRFCELSPDEREATRRPHASRSGSSTFRPA